MAVLEKIKKSSKSLSNYKDDPPQNSKTQRKSASRVSSVVSKNSTSFFEKLDSNKEKLNHFKNLELNWNFSNALPFTQTLITKVENLLEHLTVQPKIFPTGRQSIQFEYEKTNGDYLEFEVFEDSVIYLLIKNNTEIEKQIPLNHINFNQLINNFYA
jgi:hypothetical protein